jgi:hypothetical protein
MHKSARRLISVLAAAGAVVAMSAAPALARPVDAPVSAPAASGSWLSDTTQEAWDKWNEGGCLVGEGAAQMVSAAVVGLPFLASDLASGKNHLSEPTELAWLTWNEGGGKLGQGSAQLVSSAWIGVPSSALDFFKAALDAGAPEGAEWKTWSELTPQEQEFVGYECGYIF